MIKGVIDNVFSMFIIKILIVNGVTGLYEFVLVHYLKD